MGSSPPLDPMSSSQENRDQAVIAEDLPGLRALRDASLLRGREFVLAAVAPTGEKQRPSTRMSGATPLTGTQSQHSCLPPKSAAATLTPITPAVYCHRTWDLRHTTKLPAPSAPLTSPGDAHGSSMTSPYDLGGHEKKRGGGLGAVCEPCR